MMTSSCSLDVGCEHLRVTHADGVGRIEINRPERHNALNIAMWRALPTAMEALAAIDTVRVIVLTGAGGKAFSSGADISEFSGARADAEGAREYERINLAALEAISACRAPVIAAVDGICMGGGLALALACDVRIAGQKARFCLPPARLGLAYPTPALASLVACVSVAVAREMLYSARVMDATEAGRVGLVNRVVASDRLEGEVAALCHAIADNAPLSILHAKRTLDALSMQLTPQASRRLDALAAACFDSADYAEGRAAFREKRKPRFRGV